VEALNPAYVEKTADASGDRHADTATNYHSKRWDENL
jgi:hypothetical protein